MNSPNQRNEDEGEPQNGSPSSRPDKPNDSDDDSSSQPQEPTDEQHVPPIASDGSVDGDEQSAPNLPATQPAEDEDGDEEDAVVDDDEDDRPPDIAENKNLQRLVEGLPPEKRAELFAVIRQETSSHSGWLPTPDFMRQYDQLLPGLAERIVRMPEREQSHRHMMTDTIIARDYRLRTTGQWMGMGALVLILAFCAFLAVLGNTAAAAWVAAVVIIGTVGIFVTGQISANSTTSKDEIEKPE